MLCIYRLNVSLPLEHSSTACSRNKKQSIVELCQRDLLMKRANNLSTRLASLKGYRLSFLTLLCKVSYTYFLTFLTSGEPYFLTQV